MKCEEAKFKISALIDNELTEQDIQPFFEHLSVCISCRKEYMEQLELHKHLNNPAVPEPSQEWYQTFHKTVLRKITGIGGRIFFIGSYFLLIVYAVYRLFISSDTELLLKLIIGGISFGFILLLGVSIADRIRESKDDRYKGVIR